jgi:DNA-binding response OmpR family regulator
VSARFTSSTPSVDAHANRCEARIIVAESSSAVGHELVAQLCADRFSAVLAHTAEHARAHARAQPVRAIVLGSFEDPRGAFDLLEEIRRGDSHSVGGSVWEESLPAIVLSEGDRQLDLLRAFEMGADDFIARVGPYYMELRARLRAVLRRSETPSGVRLRYVGPLEIDTDAHLVRVAGQPIQLRRLEYELLIHLARNPTRVAPKQELLHTIWHKRPDAGVRTVDSHASRLRRKLGAAGAAGLVVNVWGVGYRLL